MGRHRSHRCHRCGVLALSLALASSLLGSAPANAADRFEQGWWTTMNQGGSTPVTPPWPDVPKDGLLVQGGQDSPTAYTALAFAVPAGVTAGELSLSVTPQSLSTPSAGLQACPLTSPAFTPARGGPASEAPTHDCDSKKAVTAQLTGATYKLNVSNLVASGVLAVALLPADTSARIVLDRPTSNALAIRGMSSPGTSGNADSGTTTADSSTGPGNEGAGRLGAPGLSDAGLPLVSDSTPSDNAAAPAPQLADRGAAATDGRALATAAQPAATEAKAGAGPLPLVLIRLLLLLGAAWGLASRQASEAEPNSQVSPGN